MSETGFVVCHVDVGPDFFITLIGGDRETTLTANLRDKMQLTSFSHPDRRAGLAFQAWVRDAHPDRSEEILDPGTGRLDGFRASEEAGETLFEFLDEYLAFRNNSS